MPRCETLKRAKIWGRGCSMLKASSGIRCLQKNWRDDMQLKPKTFLHAGSIQSDLQRTTPKLLNWFLRAVLLHPTPYGAITQLYAGTAPEAKDYNGQFLVPWARVGEHTRASSDPEVALRLWNWFEGEVKAWEESHSSE